MSKSSEFIEIDGSYLEGGGQCLRNALSLSCILQLPVRITNIRANRPKPGLSYQHLNGLDLLVKITNATVKGNFMRSQEVEFTPQAIEGGDYMVDTRTAASIMLVYQVALPVLLFAGRPSRVDVIGGTDVKHAPQFNYMQYITRPNLKRFGVDFQLHAKRYGFYPRGGGHCVLDVEPIRSLCPIELVDFGAFDKAEGWAYHSKRISRSCVMNIQTVVTRDVRRQWPGIDCNIRNVKYKNDEVDGSGGGIVVAVSTTSGCILGASSICMDPVESHQTGVEAASQIRSCIHKEICLDPNMQDQVILYMALATGCSRIKIGFPTQHTRTAIYVAEKMTNAKFTLTTDDQGRTLLTCDGIGIKNILLK